MIESILGQAPRRLPPSCPQKRCPDMKLKVGLVLLLEIFLRIKTFVPNPSKYSKLCLNYHVRPVDFVQLSSHFPTFMKSKSDSLLYSIYFINIDQFKVNHDGERYWEENAATRFASEKVC